MTDSKKDRDAKDAPEQQANTPVPPLTTPCKLNDVIEWGKKVNALRPGVNPNVTTTATSISVA